MKKFILNSLMICLCYGSLLAQSIAFLEIPSNGTFQSKLNQSLIDKEYNVITYFKLNSGVDKGAENYTLAVNEEYGSPIISEMAVLKVKEVKALVARPLNTLFECSLRIWQTFKEVESETFGLLFTDYTYH